MFSIWLQERNKTNSVKGWLIEQALMYTYPENYVKNIIDRDVNFEGVEDRKAAIRLMWEFDKAHLEVKASDKEDWARRKLEIDAEIASRSLKSEQAVPFPASTYLKVLKSLGLPL